MRTGSEPTTARSPLRMRLWLSAWGVIWAIFGTVAFALVGRPGWAIVCGPWRMWRRTIVRSTVATSHNTPHTIAQPGRDIPPYQPPGHRYP